MLGSYPFKANHVFNRHHRTRVKLTYKIPLILALFPDFFRSNSGKSAEIIREKAETFPEKNEIFYVLLFGSKIGSLAFRFRCGFISLTHPFIIPHSRRLFTQSLLKSVTSAVKSHCAGLFGLIVRR